MINRLQHQLFWSFLTLTFFSVFSTSIHACVSSPSFPICAAKCVIFSSHTATCIIGSQAPNHLNSDDLTPIVAEKNN
ncbi:hypothetical protein SAMN02982990_01775 [Photorhabdus luminescens]|uniref:Secreted protein n=1 Tax=Photorhabdus luminescens TaxID=29488 RepID=A0A1G5QJ43_PHOLU|nr:hypothetical protein SAMN02982990_01775 [Photorhabdus luminescens]